MIVGIILAKMESVLILWTIIDVSVPRSILEEIVTWSKNVEMAMLEKIVICLVQLTKHKDFIL